MCQDSPVRGLWLCTVWASAASVDPAVTAMEGGVGMIATFGGLVLLAVLLTTISDRLQTIRETRVGNPAPGDMVNTGNILPLIYKVLSIPTGCGMSTNKQNTKHLGILYENECSLLRLPCQAGLKHLVQCHYCHVDVHRNDVI